MVNTPPSGKGSRTGPVVVGPPVLVPNLSKRDRAAAVAALTDIFTAWWTRQQTAADRPDVRPEPWSSGGARTHMLDVSAPRAGLLREDCIVQQTSTRHTTTRHPLHAAIR
jgi:hypothetical protein